MGRAPCCDKDGLKKGPWIPEEDQKLIDYIQKNGCGNWRTLPKKAGLQRCGKSCRLRWTNYLRPDIKRGKFSLEEEEAIIQLHRILGNKWSAIASRLPGRTDNEIKNYWNTNIRKKLLRMGIDPITHSPRLDLLDLSTILNPSIYSNNNISRLLGIRNLVINPDLIKLLLPNYQRNHYNQDSLQIQNPQTLISSDNQLLNDDGNRIQTHQNLVQDLSTTCHGDDQLLQNGFDCDQWQHGSNGPMISTNPHEDYVPVITDCGPYYGLDRAFADQNLSSESSNFQSNLSIQSVLPNLSSPSSISATPLSSNSIFGEEERESYCSSSNMLLKYDMQDIWDVNDFM